MAATIVNQDKISLKVLLHKGQNKVIFAEADSNFVDALFSTMTLPLATIVRILGKSPDERLNPLASLQNLHKSLVELPACYMSAEESKFMLLNPRTSMHDACRNLKLKVDDTEPIKFFICKNAGCNPKSRSYFSTCSVARCCHCRKEMTREIKYNGLYYFDPTQEYRHEGGVLVPELETFLVTDDLFVVPNALDSRLRLLRDRGFTDASQLETQTIDIGREQMLILLRAALSLKYPLTYLVFRIIHPIGTPVRDSIFDEEDMYLKTMTMNLTLQKSTSRFLFAEAGEDFVDFLFSFFLISLGTIFMELLNDKTYLESLENLYDSIHGMSFENSKRWDDVKYMLIEPQLAWQYVSGNRISPIDSPETSPEINYLCSVLGGTMIQGKQFGSSMYNLRFKDPTVERKFLKKATKFMITDDLIVTPFSTDSAIAKMNNLKVPLKDVEHHVVSVGLEEGWKIFNASLKSRSTLSDVLLGPIIKKKKRDAEEFQSLSKKQGGPNMEQIIGLKRKK